MGDSDGAVMLFLIDENLPEATGKIFLDLGFEVDYVSFNSKLRSKPDEDIFKYACKKRTILVTRDVGFMNLVRFPFQHLPGAVLIRFPNEILTQRLCKEVSNLVRGLGPDDFLHNLLVIEPGSIRKRSL